MSDCVFCKIIKGDIPSTKLYEDENILAFLDIMPANKGHTLVIPKKHYETLTDVPVDELEKLTKELQKITVAVVKATNAEGFNVVMNNKEVAGQVVPHAHFHIVPRFPNDGMAFKWPTKKYEDGEVDKFKEKIISFL
jgi:histidine triad (HIT) family protein|tara:strand:+ start:397 stop:807 length:411 start_codon:yes stop_codon:yes gene_type:complete